MPLPRPPRASLRQLSLSRMAWRPLNHAVKVFPITQLDYLCELKLACVSRKPSVTVLTGGFLRGRDMTHPPTTLEFVILGPSNVSATPLPLRVTTVCLVGRRLTRNRTMGPPGVCLRAGHVETGSREYARSHGTV